MNTYTTQKIASSTLEATHDYSNHWDLTTGARPANWDHPALADFDTHADAVTWLNSKPAADTDEVLHALINAHHAGCPTAASTIYRAFMSSIMRLAFTARTDDDPTAAALAALWESITSIPGTKTHKLAATITLNARRGLYNAAEKRAKAIHETPINFMGALEEEAIPAETSSEWQQTLTTALAAEIITPEEAQTLTWRAQDYNWREIAQKLSIKVPAAERRGARALTKMKAYYSMA